MKKHGMTITVVDDLNREAGATAIAGNIDLETEVKTLHDNWKYEEKNPTQFMEQKE